MFRGNAMKRARVLVADDHRMLAEGLRSLLEPEFELVGIVEDGRTLVTRAKELCPDVIIADITMPLLNGIEAVRQLQKADVPAKVVFLTMHQDVSYAAKAFELGAAGFVLKHSAASELVTALREALAGRTYVTPLIAGELMRAYRDGGAQRQDPAVDLTPRQREALQLFAEGRSAKEVAAILKISPRTAEVHKANVMKMLGIRTTAELAQYAVRHGIIPS
jgi:DNA-binding NarL/FixJ family response regulator